MCVKAYMWTWACVCHSISVVLRDTDRCWFLSSTMLETGHLLLFVTMHRSGLACPHTWGILLQLPFTLLMEDLGLETVAVTSDLCAFWECKLSTLTLARHMIFPRSLPQWTSSVWCLDFFKLLKFCHVVGNSLPLYKISMDHFPQHLDGHQTLKFNISIDTNFAELFGHLSWLALVTISEYRWYCKHFMQEHLRYWSYWTGNSS